MKLIHLSDLHIAADDRQNEPVRQRFHYIRNHYNDRRTCLVISGDIIDNEGNVPPGTPVPMEDAGLFVSEGVNPQPLSVQLPKTRAALENARQIISLFPAERVFFCCGNHDVAIMGNYYNNAYAELFDEHLWKPLNRSKKVLMAGAHFGMIASSTAKYPLVYTLISEEGVTVRLISCNSCPDTEQDISPFNLSAGKMGNSLLQRLRTLFLPDQLIPYLGSYMNMATIMFFHHHPWVHVDWADWRWAKIFEEYGGIPGTALDDAKRKIMEENLKLVDSEEFLGVIAGSVDLVMFGHKHKAGREPNRPGLRYGGLAAGSSRFETEASQVMVSRSGISFENVRIV